METLPEIQTAGEPSPSDEAVDLLFFVMSGSAPLLEMAPVPLANVSALFLSRGTDLGVTGGPSELRLTIPDPHVSDPHARVFFRNGAVWVEDLDSRNGTFVDGVLCKQSELTDGALLTVGRTAFIVRRERAQLAATLLPVTASPDFLKTRSLALAVTFRRLAQLAKTNVPVFFSGDTGTGKEVSARALHSISGRTGAFVAINCGALPEHLIESELFGYKRGAFSGALTDRKGLVKAAQGGTLFLDEIGDLPAGAQVKLLRVLQEREVIPLGASEPEPVDFRLITATHRDLAALVATGAFRNDLWSRLRGFEVTLPSLAERREDLGLLIAQLLKRHAGTAAAGFRFDRSAVDLLLRHQWPLNIRELERLLEIVVSLASGNKEIGADMIAPLLAPVSPAKAPTKAKLDSTQLHEELRRLLALHHGNVAAVARDLGHTRMQIHRWMKRFSLSPQDFR